MLPLLCVRSRGSFFKIASKISGGKELQLTLIYKISISSPASALLMLRTAQNFPHMLQVSL